ncbi:MAG: WbqC family protein [Bacteroidota bacterium]|nr:WbqC family protein [Bacteroidota bacterium]
MKIAIMQPYFMPYIGYYQLMKLVDSFVFYDDVMYIKKGWINRNRILLNGREHLFSIHLNKVSQNKKINSIEIGNNRMKVLKTLEHAYKKAPFFQDVEPLLHAIFKCKQRNLSKYVINTNRLIANYLRINTPLLVSSEIEKNNDLKKEKKLIEICHKLKAKTYVNLIGGQNLYLKTDFAQAGIELCFLNPQPMKYKQFNNKFVPSLSIIDVMMFNSVEDIHLMLDNFKVV